LSITRRQDCRRHKNKAMIAIDLFAKIGMGLCVAFPVYALFFILWMWKRRGVAGPTHRTMVVYVLAVILCGFCFYAINRRGAWTHPSGQAMRILGTVFIHQVAYWGEFNTYAGGPRAFYHLGYSHHYRMEDESSLYSLYCGGDSFPAEYALIEGDPLFYRPGIDWPEGAPLPKTLPYAFTCMAMGNIDRDATVDVWTINDAKHLVNVIDDTGDDGSGPDRKISFNGWLFLKTHWGGPYYLVLGIVTPFLIMSFIVDFIIARRERREIDPGNGEELIN